MISMADGGATGALAALHLARALPDRKAEILLVEPAEAIGRGLAYATDDPRHLLNVRVANMSALADQPDHLPEWLRREGPVRGGSVRQRQCPREDSAVILPRWPRQSSESSIQSDPILLHPAWNLWRLCRRSLDRTPFRPDR